MSKRRSYKVRLLVPWLVAAASLVASLPMPAKTRPAPARAALWEDGECLSGCYDVHADRVGRCYQLPRRPRWMRRDCMRDADDELYDCKHSCVDR